ncbi:MAG: ABC transporter ATP-binding protein [Erysipelotrichaceae bacterium]
MIKRLLGYLIHKRLMIVVAIGSGMLSVLLTLFVPIMIGNSVDLIIGINNVNMIELKECIVVLVLLIVGSSCLSYIMELCVSAITNDSMKRLRNDCFNKLYRLELSWIDNKSHGDITARIVNDIDQIGIALIASFSTLLTGILTLVGTLIFMLMIDLPVALLVLGLTPLSLMGATFIAKRTHKYFIKVTNIRGNVNGFLQEMLNNQKLVKLYNQEANNEIKFKELNEELYERGWRAQYYSSLVNPSTRFINNIVYACVTALGAYRVIYSGMSIGILTSFLAYANQFAKPLNEISNVTSDIQSGYASLNRVFNLLDEDEIKQTSKKKLSVTNGTVEVRNASFSYTNNKTIDDISFKAISGSKIAIVGPTGCGKTTLINLLMRFYELDKGQILIDEQPINEYTIESIASCYGMVLQETFIFSGTIKDNISYGNPHATIDQITKAAHSAYADEFIDKLPLGYDTYIDNDGGSLSKGQRQLICIARVMLYNPRMLILDEATSSIDTITEIRVQEAFDKMMLGRTSFVVAHRLSTIKEADLILVMDKGKIIERGKHAELLELKGFYRRLYDTQFK